MFLNHPGQEHASQQKRSPDPDLEHLVDPFDWSLHQVGTVIPGSPIVPDASAVDENVDWSESSCYGVAERIDGFFVTEIGAKDVSSWLADQPTGFFQTLPRSCDQADPRPRGTQSHCDFSA